MNTKQQIKMFNWIKIENNEEEVYLRRKVKSIKKFGILWFERLYIKKISHLIFRQNLNQLYVKFKLDI